MNSVAGNKERLAVSNRGKKYGVSCDGFNTERRYQTHLGRGGMGESRRPARGPELSSRCRDASAGGPGCACGEAGLLRGHRHTRLALGFFFFSVGLILPFPRTHNFCGIPGLLGRVKPKGMFPMNSLPLVTGFVSRDPGDPFILPAGSGGLFPE